MVKKVQNLKDVIGCKFVILEQRQARALANGSMFHIEGSNIVLEMVPTAAEARAVDHGTSAAKQRDSATRRMENKNKEEFYKQGRITL